MTEEKIGSKTFSEVWGTLSPAALAELKALGLRGPTWQREKPARGIDPVPGRPVVKRRAVHAPRVINEAYDYARPSSFSRGVRVELQGADLLLLSGTASVNEDGKAAHPGDFRAQCLRTYRNLTELLAAEGASWHDVVRTTCYLRDIERDYAAFNEMRTLFFKEIGLDPLPASTGIQARLCWSELLVEIELMAVVPAEALSKK
jgi:2-iminobutanoate/2-iminopropanoate deaminase